MAQALPKTKAKITARKFEGDDAYSWAVFVDGRPVYSGLTKREVPYYKLSVAKAQAAKEAEAANS